MALARAGVWAQCASPAARRGAPLRARAHARRARRAPAAAQAGKRWSWKDGERVERKEGGDAGDVVASSAGGADAAQGAAEGGDERDFVAFERQGKGGSSKRRKAKLNDSSARLGRGAVKKAEVAAEPWEKVFVQVLFALGALILLDGTIIATSAFLPEFVDDFAAGVLYPTFNYVIALFFLMSASFGAYKYVQGAFE